MAHQHSSNETNRRISVLVVDDNFLVSEGIKHIAETIGCIVVGQAFNGLEAIELSKALQPDIVLMDVDMPVMNGLQAAPNCCGQVIFVTGNNLTDIIEQAHKVGVFACLSKPVTTYGLQQVLASSFSEKFRFLQSEQDDTNIKPA
jgi:response regulator NasT